MSMVTRSRFPFLASLLLGAYLLVPEALSGQESTTRGWNLGFHLQGATLAVEGEEGDGGGGVGIRAGYGFNRIFTLYLEMDGITVDSENAEDFQGTWSLGHVDLGARFHFANSLRSWVPYLEAALGYRGAEVKDVAVGGDEGGEVTINGSSFSLGGGMMFYFKQTFALDLGLKVSSGEFTEIEIGALSIGGLDVDATSTRFKVGLVWWL